jgi:hypothetical protein
MGWHERSVTKRPFSSRRSPAWRRIIQKENAKRLIYAQPSHFTATTMTYNLIELLIAYCQHAAIVPIGSIVNPESTHCRRVF